MPVDGANRTVRLRPVRRVGPSQPLKPQQQRGPGPKPSAAAAAAPEMQRDFSEIDWDAMDEEADASLREERRREAKLLERSGAPPKVHESPKL